MAKSTPPVQSCEGEHDQDDFGATHGQRMSKLTRGVIVLGVLCATFLFALDATIVAVIQPLIVQQLGDIEKLPWITVAFELGGAGANLCWGKLYGSFDHKVLFITAIALFEIGSAVCGAAPSMNALIVGRVVAGIGGNGIYIGTMNILSTLTTIQERPLFLSFYGVIWASGVVLGPIIGGAFAAESHTGWRWSFYINLCISALFAPVYLFLLPSHNPQHGHTVLNRFKKMDFLGVVLFAGAYTSGVMAISFGGATYTWHSAKIIALFCTCGVLWIAFVCQQGLCVATTPEQRLFPVHLLQDYENWILFAETALGIAALFLSVYFIPLYFQFVHGYSPLKSGVRLLPLICLGVVFCLLNGGLMGIFGYYMPWFLGGALAIVAAAALLRTIQPDTTDSTVYGYSVLMGIGVGAFAQAGFPIIQAKYPERESSNVLAFIGCAQLTGLTLSFSIGNAIFINRATSRITDLVPNETRAHIQAAIVGVGAKSFQALPRTMEQEILSAVSASIADVYTQVLAGGASAVVLALFLRRQKLFVPESAQS